MNYFEVYEKLYELGYHAKAKNHGRQYVDYICQNYEFRTVLEVGCSNGIAVKDFRIKNRKTAYGIDASEIAVRYANEKYYARQCIVGLANDIPFKDKFFDTVFFFFLLEHLTEPDAKKAVSEISRVAKKFLFLVIDGAAERNHEFLNKAKKAFPEIFDTVDNLHLTIQPVQWWVDLFNDQGWKLIYKHDLLLIFGVE